MNIPLPELKRQLEELLLDLQHLSTALQKLRDLLPEHSEKRVTVLTLLGRLNDANKKALRGTLDNTALQTEYNSIRADLSDFVQALDEADFDATPQSGKEDANKAKNGHVLYRIPHQMTLREESECVVRIAIDEDAIGEEIMLDDQVVVKGLTRVSDLMQVELGDPAKEAVFEIRSTSPPQQLITEDGFTEWFFYVAPQQTGTHPLEVKVSVLEMAFNQIHRKVLVFRETIQITTEHPEVLLDKKLETPAPAATGDGFKKAGEALAFAGQDMPPIEQAKPESAPPPAPIETTGTIYEAPKSMPQPESPRKSSGRARNVALFMVFILAGTSATWALTPSEIRDWWVASIIQDDEQAYTAYIEKHPDSRFLEKALYNRAEKSTRLAYLRAYQDKYPDGKYRTVVSTRITKLETAAIDSIRRKPSPENISRFVDNFPESTRLSDIKLAAETTKEDRGKILQAVEEAYITSAKTKPTVKKITDYLQDFPEQNRLDELTEAAASNPEIMSEVQPVLEEAYLKKMEQNPSPDKAEQFLEQFPEPVKKDKFDQIISKRPEVRKAVDLRRRRMQ